MSSASENSSNITGDRSGASPGTDDANLERQIATKLDRLEEMNRDIEQLDAITSEISQNVSASGDVQSVSQQVSLLEPRLSTIQNSLFEHQVELRSELHAMRAEFGKLQQQQDREMWQLEKVRDRLQEKMNTLGLSQKTQNWLMAIIGLALLTMFGWIGLTLIENLRRANAPVEMGSPEAFVLEHLQDIRDGKLEEAWGQAAVSFQEQASQGDLEAYKDWWTQVAYPITENTVTSVAQVKLYTEWSYCNRETNKVIQNTGFWHLSKVGGFWQLDRIEIPPNRPAREVGSC
ncbi:MAG: hypothetical protein ACFB9N_16255 [Geitlerinemataceae cyanobacterium]